MFALGLHACGGNRPHTLSRIDLLPRGPAHLVPPRRRQHQELEGQLQDPGRIRSPYRLNGRCHLAMRQRPEVLHNVFLRAEHPPDPVAGVVGPEVHRHGPFQHPMHALADGSGRGRL